MNAFKPDFRVLIGLPIVATVSTAGLLMFAAVFIDGLPRLMRGESVLVPWPGCVLFALLFAICPPWLLFLPMLDRPSRRIYFLLCLVCAALGWYCFGGYSFFLSKAYRRGL